MDNCGTEPEPTEAEKSKQNVQDNQNNNLDLNAEEKSPTRRTRKLDREEQKKSIMRSGKHFISAFNNRLEKNKACKEVRLHYFERVLHSIFFFGYINTPPISPNEFLPEKQFEQFKKFFPRPFNEYTTHLPYYTPYSILLEYMTECLKPENPHLFWKELAKVNELLHPKEKNQPITNDFVSSVVTYCCIKDSSTTEVLKEAYGSSMSCKGKTQREIMIAISVLHVWDRAVSYAVCSADNGPPITFPEEVHCSAYNFNTQRETAPCKNCIKMFDVKYIPKAEEHNEDPKWPKGNCAESESLSRLLKSDEGVRKKICIKGVDGKNLMNRDDIENAFKEKYEDERKSKVKQLLTPRKFKLTSREWNFFTPTYLV